MGFSLSPRTATTGTFPTSTPSRACSRTKQRRLVKCWRMISMAMMQEVTWSLRYLWTFLLKDPAFVEVISIFLHFVWSSKHRNWSWNGPLQWWYVFWKIPGPEIPASSAQERPALMAMAGWAIHFLHSFNLIIIFQISWLFHAFHAKPWLPGDRFQRISGQVWFLLYANGSWPARAAVTGGQACGQALWRVATLILCVFVWGWLVDRIRGIDT